MTSPSVPARLAAVKPQMLSGRFAPLLTLGETDRKKVSAEHRQMYGRLIGRALDLAGISPKAAALDLGYANQSVITKWVEGIEPPVMWKLMGLPGFVRGFVLALAEYEGVGAEVTIKFPAVNS